MLSDTGIDVCRQQTYWNVSSPGRFGTKTWNCAFSCLMLMVRVVACSQLVSDDVYEKHLQLSAREAESCDAHSYHCATPDCAGWCSYEDDVNSFFCYRCHRFNCLTCRAIHDGKDCLEYQRELRENKYKDKAAMLAQSTLEVATGIFQSGLCVSILQCLQ